MKNFFDCKNEKITEKAFSRSLMISIFSILLCIVLLCSVTYAWFSEGVTSNANTITSGHFELDDISILKTDGGEAVLIDPPAMSNGEYVYLLDQGIYEITLTLDNASKAKGHCIIEINGEQKHTDAIIGENTANKDGYTVNSPFAFTLEIKENGTQVRLRPIWGVSVYADISDGESYASSEWVSSQGE